MEGELSLVSDLLTTAKSILRMHNAFNAMMDNLEDTEMWLEKCFPLKKLKNPDRKIKYTYLTINILTIHSTYIYSTLTLSSLQKNQKCIYLQAT